MLTKQERKEYKRIIGDLLVYYEDRVIHRYQEMIDKAKSGMECDRIMREVRGLI